MIAVTPGQAGDSPQLVRLLDELSIERLGHGRARTTPLALRADKAYSSRAHRELLRRRHVHTVIPEPDDQKRNRARRGSRGGRPVGFDADDYKNRNVVERGFNQLKGWRGLATRYDKHALIFRGGLVLRAILLWLQTTTEETRPRSGRGVVRLGVVVGGGRSRPVG
ncbi:hypothetical protein GCM10023200_16210 [Actinomycetospora chlora]|uniref:Transposase IS4-like domain-containing protein n=1 Tax=Actinomycetospora chlora TaxID=663608 RepID=A0ABP9AMZ7_9PSEU